MAIAFLVSCGGGDPATAPTAPVAVGTVAPTTPAPSPTPATTAGRRCTLPLVTEASRGCPREAPVFLEEMDAAITLLTQQRPDLFEGNYVRSPGQYYLGVLANLEAAGLCANFDGEEMQVKNGNGFSEQYHILTSSQFIRRGDVTYRATCYPAAFFTSPPPVLPQRGDCRLPSSESLACTRESPKYLGQVQAAIERLRREKPDIFRNEYVLDSRAYYDGVVAILKTQFSCAMFDGEEIALKNDNGSSEQYHVLYSWGAIRNDQGAYRVSCYPAAF